MTLIEPTVSPAQSSLQEEESDTIVVTGKRLSEKPEHTPEPRLNITIDFGGSINPLSNDWINRTFRDWFGDATHFDVSKSFTDRQKAIIAHVLKEMSNLPQYQDRMREYNSLNLDVNIVVNNGLIGADGQTILPGGPLQSGQSVTIEIAISKLAEVPFIKTLIHELHHFFYAGLPEQDLPHTTNLADTVFRTLFPDFATMGILGELPPPVIPYGDPASAPPGDPGVPQVYIGDDSGQQVAVTSPQATVYSGSGSDTIFISNSSSLTEIVDQGGSDTVVLADVVNLSTVTARWSADGQDLGL